MAKFTKLKVLNLSFNSIRKIEFIPPNLEELYLNGNEINEVALSAHRPIGSLLHLGLSMNRIRQTALTQIVKGFPNLFCLDISFNDLSDMENTLLWCHALGSLKMIALEGNPLVLTRNYKKVIIERLPGLKVLDGNTIFAE